MSHMSAAERYIKAAQATQNRAERIGLLTLAKDSVSAAISEAKSGDKNRAGDVIPGQEELPMRNELAGAPQGTPYQVLPDGTTEPVREGEDGADDEDALVGRPVTADEVMAHGGHRETPDDDCELCRRAAVVDAYIAEGASLFDPSSLPTEAELAERDKAEEPV